MGLEYTTWNFKGHSVPLISDEAGVGRGLEPLTSLLNIDGGQGGNQQTSYGPAPTFITSTYRGFVFDQKNIGIADFSN